MGSSDYVHRLRAHVGNDLLLLPGASAVILDDEGRVLLGSHLPSGRWGFIGGSIEPEESPHDAVVREIREELGAESEVLGLVGAYGGAQHTARYPNGDVVSYVLVAYRARLTSPIGALEEDEIASVGWFTPDEVTQLDRFDWIDEVLADALARD
jgi:8-oxo-dGTP pyrophosphatase MutT (NUDIX family)